MRKIIHNNNVFLIGPMGAGKTSVGRELAQKLDKSFHDLDLVLEARTGVSVARIFDEEGEAGFRAREKALLEELCALDNIVLATGGGVVLDKDNRRLLQRRGLVIYMHADVDLQLQRLSKDKTRPLLNTPDRRARLEGLLVERDCLYRGIAEVVIDSKPLAPARMAEEVCRQLSLRHSRESGNPVE